MKKLICIILIATLPLSGCGALIKSDYQRPETATPAQWSSALTTASSPADWPADFGDPELTRLVALALERNNDLAAAAIRVRKARLQAGLAAAELHPDLSAGLGTNSQKDLHQGDWETSHSAEVGIGYEVDLWGRLARARDAADWEALATEQDRQSAALSLTGTVMQLYWAIAYDSVRLELSRSNIGSAQQAVDLTEAQEQFGAASQLEVSQARQNLASLLASHQTLEQARQEDLNALAVLFDMPPGEIMADPADLDLSTLPDIPAGVPAELLGRRPDLRALELRLREYLANTDAARASFYPTLSLTGSLGTASTELSDLMNHPVAALVTSLALPLLNWNTLQLNLDVSRADYEEAVVTFRQTLYESMAEVENGLSNRSHLTAQADHLNENLAEAREIERIYEVRYRTGSGTLKDWLDAQDTRRTAEQSVAENRYNRLINHVTLYQALGGQPAAE